MTSVADGEGGAGESLMAPLVDLTRFSVHSLLHTDNAALALCLQRLLRDLDDPDGVISAFANTP